ncbi:kinase-like domain-containing protein [Microdochium trichocladiopsis]|uniref:1-phosphatidylinositol 4-kinase n=1 Tax=Microdochium trichocladiopsis TaxID=1682393 RepID=A0A9P9C0G7_9PEZI|nr:kinase-like domain-containing protein [Microdochium trichocladiopsis]KAH7041084.1 kinase-like domain-containing protein [Microdochium trichocladiopsis]
MSWDLLQRFIESDVFNQDPFLSVSYLSRYADHVGITYVLCSKLRQFPYEDVEFFLPQLCHLIISVDNESMALEEFLLDLCEESVSAALLTFWLFQFYLHDLARTPQTQAFRTCRRVYNKVQHIVFGLSDAPRNDKIKENTLPVTVLASFVLASVGVPLLPKWAGPLAIAQARKAQPDGDVVHETATPTIKVARSKTVTGTTTTAKPRRPRESPAQAPPADQVASPNGNANPRTPIHRSSSSEAKPTASAEGRKPAYLESRLLEARLSSASLPLPEARSPRAVSRPSTPISAGIPRPGGDSISRRHSSHIKTMMSKAELTPKKKARLLRQNYFRSQLAFLTALEDISTRLVIVPKPARLSALRAELALIARDLPAEIDVPVLSPPTLVDGKPGSSRHHRIVRINPAEATVLNSAEKVPYLLMIEVLRDDFNFDPESPDNERLLSTLIAEQGSRKRLFDLTDAQRLPASGRPSGVGDEQPDSVFEPVSGDLGSSPMLKPAEPGTPPVVPQPLKSPLNPMRFPSGATGSSMAEVMGTPRTSGTSTSRSSSPGPLRRGPITSARNASVDQPDFSALATHMRTASQMLAQLEATSGKRPKHEVAAIRTKIIASMQSLEEQSFDLDDGQGPTFDLIMAKNAASAAASVGGEPDSETADMDDVEALDPASNTSAGAARMENDAMTGGVQRKGDRDDPSAAVFGEAWHMKKERIRQSSPYGWMKNWDLVSVIVKTGDDLRQEAFACQLIKVCHKIWTDAGVRVWVKLMRILVAGESAGLIETITNGVSLHSLKRSLTLASIEAGINPRRRFATLKDHWVKTFGKPDSEPYRAAVDAFKRSLAAYSMISYILQLKDRHNGNVLIDNEGHIVHIDFGFMLSNSPGSVGFEAAPFKLTYEYVEVLGGVQSEDFADFKALCKQAFQALRRSADSIIDLVSIMGRDSKMPCYAAGVGQATTALRQRFQLHLSADEAEAFVETDLIGKSLGSYYTRLYDTFQYRTQGIY